MSYECITGIKQNQSLSIVTCSVCMFLRVYTEVLKSYSHHVAWSDPHLVWYMVKTANFPAIVAQRCSISICISDMKRSSAHNHLKNFCEWHQRSWTHISHFGPCKAGGTGFLIGVFLCCVYSEYWFATYRETQEAILFAIMFSLLLFLWQITFIQLSES